MKADTAHAEHILTHPQHVLLSMQTWFKSRALGSNRQAEPTIDHRSNKDKQELLKKSYDRKRNVTKQLVRLKKREKASKKQMGELNNRLSGLTKRLANVESSKASETRIKTVYMTKHRSVSLQNQVLRAKMRKLQAELDHAKQQIAHLSSQLKQPQAQSARQQIRTLAGKPPRYNDNVRLCCIQLLAHNLGINHVSPVIQAVVNTLTPFSIGRLPSPAKMSAFLAESKQIVLAQIGEVLASEENLTRHRDGTSKQGKKYYGAQVSCGKDQHVLNIGLSNMKSGTAEHSFEVLTDMFSDVQTACANAGTATPVANQIIKNIKNTMTDRCIVEKNVNTLLEQYRSTILPSVTAGWCDLSDEAKASLGRMNNFYCGLHYLVGLADQAQKCLAAWEKLHVQTSNGSDANSEAGTVRLIRTACKALEAHCNEQSGNHTAFEAFLQARGVDDVPLARFVGYRFNILFHNAGGVYYLKDHMLAFYDTAFGTPNRLHAAVRSDLGQNSYLVGCRALGIIDKLITEPLWRELTRATMSEISSSYTELCKCLESWQLDASSLLDGSARPFRGSSVAVDDVHNELFIESETNDATTLAVLQIMCAAFSTYSNRLLQDHLPGGMYHAMSTEAAATSSSVATTNVCSERVFAQLDKLMREKPNSSLVAIEGIILFSANNTSEWLQQQSPEKRKALFASAISGAEQHRQLYHQRCKAIATHHQQQIQEKQRKKQEKEKQDLQLKQQLTDEVGRMGLWASQDEVALKLAALPASAAKVHALKSQIRYRKTVLNQVADKAIFQWSSGGKLHTWQELAKNLLTLISAAPPTTPSS